MKKNYIFTFLIVLVFMVSYNSSWGQLSVTSASTDFTIDFDNTVSGVNNGTYIGAGFNPSPSAGQLDGNAWRTTGFGDNHAFDATSTSGDNTRGSSTGGVSTGGLYGFEVATSDYAFGIQPIGSDFTPGTITLIVTNDTGSTVSSIELDYDVFIYNDQARANSFNFSYSTDDSAYTDVSALDVTSTAAADGGPTWIATARNTTITGLTLTNGSSIYLQWSGDDVSGSNSRDEFALDNIVVNMTAAVTSSTWTGSGGTDWATPGNWSDGVPTSSTDATIPDVANPPIISSTTGAEVKDLTITEPDGVTIDGGGSLRVSGTSSGNITYNRDGISNNWHLISSPVIGQDIDAFALAEGLATGTVGSNAGLGDYDNSAPGWTYYQSGSSGTGNFASGDGRAVNLLFSGDVSFTGTMPVSDFTSLSLTDNSGGSGNAFNLMGNPYPSYIAADNTANATNNILSINTSLLTEETIWLWDESANAGAGGYTQFNNTSGLHIAPGQGFFVSANGASSTFSITIAMQSHQGTDSFLRNTNNRPEINLVITDGTNTRDADIFYIDGTTTGFDNGYDSSMFGGVSHEFAIYTHAVADGNGRNLGIQSLPDNDFENMVIPVGINATSGMEITISAATFNLPSGVNVYLEDTTDNSFTLLDSSSDFTTTLGSDLNGIGRFYMHTSSQALSVNEVNLDNISIYTSTPNNLRVVGIQSGNAQVRIFDILGKQVVNTSFQGNGVNDVTLPNLRSGVYIIQLETETGKLNKKVIIE